MFQTTNQKTWVSRCSLQSLGTAGGNAAFGHRQGHLWMIFLRHETGDFGKRCPSMLKKVKLVLKVTNLFHGQIRLPKRAKEIGIKVRGPGKISQACSAATKWHLNIRSKF
jgi:hypothetical protein